MTDRNKILERLKDLFWFILIVGGTLGVVRFAIGLGAATNMTDPLPWGWWKIFNLLAGAAVATSGFIVAAVIYIVQAERYRPVARLSVLIGFLGYGASLIALMFDIGLPHRGWHGFFFWNPHSFLFEVFWCVSIYWSVTALELAPLVTERFKLEKLTHILHDVMLPFVVLGVTLSTMHHSSLGSLFLASPTRLHPLWYTLWIPPEFLISAMGAGLSVIVFFMVALSWVLERELDLVVARNLAKWSAALLLAFAVLKAIDFTYFQKWNFVFGPDITWESGVFWLEITLQVLIPVTLLGIPRFRNTMAGLWIGTSSAALGIIFHRLNVGITGYFTTAGQTYVPTLSELFLSFAVLSGAGLLFLFLVENFYILSEPEPHTRVKTWQREEIWEVLTGARARKTAIMAVVLVPFTLVAFQNKGTGGYEPTPNPVHVAIIGADAMRTELLIDGDRDGDAVFFPHVEHQEVFQENYDLAEEETCVKCHHLNLPEDENTNCRACHRDMDLDTPTYTWAEHDEAFEGDEYDTFAAFDLDDRHQGYQACADCHAEDMKGLADFEPKGFSHLAPGFKYAMHGTCMTCHRREMEDPTDPMATGNCRGCHQDRNLDELQARVDASDLVDAGNDKFLDGRLESAEAKYREALAIDADNPRAWYRLGVVLHLADRTEEAVVALERAAADERGRAGRLARDLLAEIRREAARELVPDEEGAG